MIVKTIELANICAIFSSLKSGRISQGDLVKIAQDSKLIDSDTPVRDVIEEAIDSGLIALKSGFFFLSKKGKKLIKTHKQLSCQLSDQTKDIFIKCVLLDINSNNWCCSEFLSEFKVDTILQTFVYDRTTVKIKDNTSWLLTLSSVGLIEVDKEKAIINKKYLGIINEMLFKIRNPIHIEISEIQGGKNEVGDLAEKLAMKYEMDRLLSAGFPSLAPLVQQISIVDQSAGYDILSFQGNGSRPSENIYIEVKGTKKEDLSFFWSSNEMNVARGKNENYFIYGYTKADTDKKCADGPIIIKNPISNLEGLGYTILALDCFVSKKNRRNIKQ